MVSTFVGFGPREQRERCLGLLYGHGEGNRMIPGDQLALLSGPPAVLL